MSKRFPEKYLRPIGHLTMMLDSTFDHVLQALDSLPLEMADHMARSSFDKRIGNGNTEENGELFDLFLSLCPLHERYGGYAEGVANIVVKAYAEDGHIPDEQMKPRLIKVVDHLGALMAVHYAKERQESIKSSIITSVTLLPKSGRDRQPALVLHTLQIELDGGTHKMNLDMESLVKLRAAIYKAEREAAKIKASMPDMEFVEHNEYGVVK